MYVLLHRTKVLMLKVAPSKVLQKFHEKSKGVILNYHLYSSKSRNYVKNLTLLST